MIYRNSLDHGMSSTPVEISLSERQMIGPKLFGSVITYELFLQSIPVCYLEYIIIYAFSCMWVSQEHILRLCFVSLYFIFLVKKSLLLTWSLTVP